MPRKGKGKWEASSSSSFTNDVEIFTATELTTMTDNWEVPLGNGSFSTVYEGNLRGKIVAVKLYNRECEDYWNNEKEALLNLHHRHIVSLLGRGDPKEMYALVLEYMPMTLEKLITAEDVNLEWATTLGILKQLASVVEYVDAMDYVIGDLKPDNVLIDYEFNIKVCDFGSAKKGGKNIPTGNISYSAQELCGTGLGNGTKTSDIFSFGTILLQLISKNNVIGTVPGARGSQSLRMQVRTYSANKRNAMGIHISARARVDNHAQRHIVDRSLLHTGCAVATAIRITDLGIECTEEEPKRRTLPSKIVGKINAIE